MWPVLIVYGLNQTYGTCSDFSMKGKSKIEYINKQCGVETIGLKQVKESKPTFPKDKPFFIEVKLLVT